LPEPVSCVIETPHDKPARLGVCSWSLETGSPELLASLARSCEVQGVQLHLDPLRTGEWDLERTRDALASANLSIFSGMMAMEGEDYESLGAIARTGGVRPDATWDANLSAARSNAVIAAHLGLTLVTFHAGFLPERADPERTTIVRRIADIADAFALQGVRLALETGQESPASLLELLDELGRDDLGVNFDPANMILYGSGEPIASLEALAPHVRQIHIKDADPTETPGQWGTERPAGKGSVNWEAFFAIVESRLPGVDLIIERESGANRTKDILGGVHLVRRLAPSLVS